MAVNKQGLIDALAKLFKSQYYTAENDPEPGVTAELPTSTGDITAHQKACAAKWKDALQTYVVGMEPSHVAATSGAATDALKTALETAFATWGNDTTDPLDCTLLEQAFADMAESIAASTGSENSTRTGSVARIFADTPVANVRPPSAVELCNLTPATGSTPFTTAATLIADRIDTWFKTGQSTTTDDNPPSKPALTLPWK